MARKRIKKSKKEKIFDLIKKNFKVSFLALFSILIIFSQSSVFNAFEAHIVNVIAQIDNNIPMLDPPGGQYCIDNVVLGKFDIPDIPGAYIWYTVGAGGDEPICDDTAHGYGYTDETATFGIANGMSIVKARTCHDGKQSTVMTWNFEFSEAYCGYVCGNGIQEGSEQCDGEAGITPGENFCSADCQLVPISDEGVVCPAGTEPNLIETVSINSNNPDGATSSATLNSGTQYLIEALGTYQNTILNAADAEYISVDSWATHLDGYDISPYFLGEGEFDLQIDGIFINWGSYSPTHEYSYLYAGTGNPVNLSVFDGDSNTGIQNPGWYGDNSGIMTAKIYECRTITPPAPICGDGVVGQPEEQCDDGGTVDGDGCSATCQIELPPAPVCGNNNTETGEECDDGNTANNDGCSATCQIEDGIGCMKINEVYYDVDDEHGDDPNDEWIELYNACDYTINLKNWYLEDNGGVSDKEEINQNHPIDSNSFVVLAANASTWSAWASIPNNAFKIALGGPRMFGGLANGGDVVNLHDNSGNLIDSVSWGTDNSAFNPSVADVLEGHSITRKLKGVDTNTANDWKDLSSPDPGEGN